MRALGGLLIAVALLVGAPLPAQVVGPQSQGVAPVAAAPRVLFRASHYDVRASLDTFGQAISAQAKIEFTANQPSRLIEVELNESLRVTSVTDASGKPLLFDRDENVPLRIQVTLPDAVPAGGKVTVQFDFSGPLSGNAANSGSGVSLAHVGRDGAYLLLPSRWFPLTDYPANRYTAEFQIEAPGTMTVAGTGTTAGAPVTVTARPATPPAGAIGNARPAGRVAPISPAAAPPPPSLENERLLHTFRVETPMAAGTFVAAPLQLNAVRAEGIDFHVYTLKSGAGTAQAYADALARVIDSFSGQFGPLPRPGLTVVQIPDGGLASYAAPGLLLVSTRMWAPQPNARLLAHLAAQQWWGDQVTAATASDVWITDGLARYSEGLYVEQSSGKEALNRALEDFAVGALMFEDAAPIASANALEPESQEYRSVVVNKGAMVFHMLRALMGDNNFFALLKDFYFRFASKTARIEDLEALAEARMAQTRAPAVSAIGNSAAALISEPVSLRPFFAQWLRSTGVPEFTLDYVVYRTPKGFRVMGKVKQNLDFFRMDVEMEIQTEGNPEYKNIEVVGAESQFSVETFGRPKAGGISLDPHNYILKSSPRLRVRAIIARGEFLAEQGRYYDAVQQYLRALEQDPGNALADFRMGEAFFYQRNYAASAQSFRDALDAATDLNTRWTEVWSHIYLGRIYDVQGDRTRAVNEYGKARETGDDTGGAQAEAEKSLKTPYQEPSLA